MVERTQLSKGLTWKVALAAVIGTVLDYYDLFIFSVAAATVFSTLFFPQSNPAAATALSLATIGIIYFTRPLGAAIFGHIGDRIGRRTTLMWTLILMGVGMLGIGFAPTYAVAGMAGVIVVSVSRLVQGIGLGGEYGNAVALLAEHAGKRRCLWSSLIWASVAVGSLLASLLFTFTVILSGGVTTPLFIDYAWRILFFFGAAVVVVAGAIRYAITESPAFQSLQRKGAVERSPAFMVLKEQWSKILRFSIIGVFGIPAVIVIPFITAYEIALGMPVALVTLAMSIGALVSVFTCILGGYLGDVIGRRNVVLIAAVLSILMLYPLLLLLNTKSFLPVALAASLAVGLPFFGDGALNALLAEGFPTRRRASGVGLSYNFMTLIAAILASAVYPVIIGSYGIVSSIPYLLTVFAILCILSASLLLRTKETKDAELTE